LRLSGLEPGQWRSLTPQEVVAIGRAASAGAGSASGTRADRRKAARRAVTP
jgi:hypothetical protein